MASHFSPRLFRFLNELADNNDRDWFNANKQRYEDEVLEPSLAFISDFGPELAKISKHFNALPKKSGGSIFRIYRDVRFSKDKRPYKTHVGIHFRHKKHKTAYAPGFYLHLEPRNCFIGAGIWHPEAPALKKIRQAIADEPATWAKAYGAVEADKDFELRGESLSRPPKGFSADHPEVEALKRKDFIAVRNIPQSWVTQPDFLKLFAGECRKPVPLVKWLCGATGVDF